MSDTNIILGLPSAGKFRSKDLIEQSIRRNIIHAFPGGGAPLTAILAWSKIEDVTEPTHTWFEKIYRTPNVQTRGTDPITSNAPTSGDSNDGTALAAGSLTTATKLYIKVINTNLIAVQDVIKVPAWDIALRVIQIVRGAADPAQNGYIVATPLRAYTYATSAKIAANTILDVIGSAAPEGSESVKQRGYRTPVRVMNQTQIFKEPFSFTGTSIKTNMKFDQTGPYKERSMDAIRDHYVKIEKALIFGQRSTTETVVDDEPLEIRTMSGILEFLKLWDAGSNGLTIDGSVYAPYGFKNPSTGDDDSTARYIKNDGGKFSIDTLERWVANISLYGNKKSSDRMVVCGSNVILAMGKAMRAQGSYRWETGQKMFGLDFNKLVTGFGNLIFVTHPLFNESPIYRNSALFLDIWSLNFRPMRDRDTILIKNIQNPSFDGRKDEWRTEGTLEFWTPMSHMFVEDMSVFDPSAD